MNVSNFVSPAKAGVQCVRIVDSCFRRNDDTRIGAETCSFVPLSNLRLSLSCSIKHDTVLAMTDHYTYRITWSSEDDEYVGLCAEFPSLSWLAPNPDEAFSGIRTLVSECISDMRANNELPPVPLADRNYSGKFIVRAPPEVHRSLAIRAAEEGTSLNRLVSARLANNSP